jgi:dipeptidyl-peptidase-3
MEARLRIQGAARGDAKVTAVKRTLAIALGLISVFAQAESPLVERVDKTAFVQIEANSFRSLDSKQQALGYWLAQASIAIDPIVYDQLSRFGLRQKETLEAVITAKDKVDAATYSQVLSFTKLFWANKGNHHEQTGQKFLPQFTLAGLKSALLAAGRKDLAARADALDHSLFDPDFEPILTAKSPEGGKDIIEASSNNFYLGVKLADLKSVTERYRLDSRLVKQGGNFVEEVYRAGTLDGRIKPGLYAEYLRRANGFLNRARDYADPPQAEVVGDLIRFYETGEYSDWLKFGMAWVQNNPSVDFVNGFIETYRDVRSAKGTSQSFVCVTDQKLSASMLKIAANASYFEERAPWDARYKQRNARPPVAKAVETLIETGDFHVTTIGDNLPNENEVHQKYGTKNFLFSSATRAFHEALGNKVVAEFAASPEEIARSEKYGAEAEELLTAMHEVIGHGSGKLNPKLTQDPGSYLKEYFSTLEEARADLVALWNVFDPKLKELGLVNSDEIGRAMYDASVRVMLTQLARIPKGDTIEEDHQRDRQLIARYIIDKTGAIALESRNGKTYAAVKDYKKMRQGVGMLLAELMRIKAEGDYAAIKALIDRYGVHFDPKLRDQIVERYNKLDLPTYWTGINADLSAKFDKNGKVISVEMSYPRDYVKQQLAYSAMNKAR